MRRRPVVLVVRQLTSSFVTADLLLLRRHFSVIDHDYRRSSHPAVRFVTWALWHRAEFDLVLSWFGDIHATVAVAVAFLLRKPSVIIAGGYDVSTLPGHGFLSTKLGRTLARSHFALCSRILAVSPSVASDLLSSIPVAREKINVVATGCDTDFWCPDPKGTGGSVLSVAIAEDWHRVWVKGLDRVVACAREMPNRRFRIVGLSPAMAERLSPLPPNLSWTSSLEPVDLRNEYRAASVYLQLSRAEGLPNVLMEAMACGCVPVVTSVGGMPNLVKGVGLIVPGDNPRAAADAIEQGTARPELARECRDRIVANFQLARREHGLERTLRDLLPQGSTVGSGTSEPATPLRRLRRPGA